MLGPDTDFWRVAGDLLRRWDDIVPVRAEDPDIRLSEVCEPFRNRIRENAEKMAAEAGIEIEFIRKRNFRNEDRVKDIIARRGEQAGLVCIFSAMEPCSTYKPWHNKQTGKTYLIPDDGKCLHYCFYYFYFMDEDLGLCLVRVPTWLPCRLQICFNGNNRLAGQMSRLGIDYRMVDNNFSHIADWQRA